MHLSRLLWQTNINPRFLVELEHEVIRFRTGHGPVIRLVLIVY